MSYSDVAHAAWSALTAYLEQRSQDLCDEVRHYPTPIAHCDEQLPGLIEQRTRAIVRFRQCADCDPMQSDGQERLQRFLAESAIGIDDTTEVALRNAVQAVMSLQASQVALFPMPPAKPGLVSRVAHQQGRRP